MNVQIFALILLAVIVVAQTAANIVLTFNILDMNRALLMEDPKEYFRMKALVETEKMKMKKTAIADRAKLIEREKQHDERFEERKPPAIPDGPPINMKAEYERQGS